VPLGSLSSPSAVDHPGGSGASEAGSGMRSVRGLRDLVLAF
jgi:hypothetical protein